MTAALVPAVPAALPPAVAAADGALVWAAVLAIGVGTFLVRASFLFLLERVEGVPPAAERALRLVPAAVLAALVAPAFVAPEGSAALLGNRRLLAGALAALVAWRTGSIVWTILGGLAALVALQAAF